jgi:hypothetical protein
MFDNRTPKRIMKGSVGERRPTGKPRNRWEDEVRKYAVKLLHIKKWLAPARHRSDWWRKGREIMAQKRAGES